MTDNVQNGDNGKQDVLLYSRRRITLTGIVSVDFYDETTVGVTTNLGETLVAEGNSITLSDVNLESGIVMAEGEFSAVYYTVRKTQKQSIIKRLFSRQ